MPARGAERRVAAIRGRVTAGQVPRGAAAVDGPHQGASPPAGGRGVQKNGGPAAQAGGRARGGLSPNRHLGGLDERTGVAIVSPAGAWHEAPLGETGFEQVPDEHALDQGVRAKGDARAKSRHKRRAEGMEPVMPPRSHRTEPYAYDHSVSTRRNNVERLLKRLKQFRRLATRDAKRACTFLGVIPLVAASVVRHGGRRQTLFDLSAAVHGQVRPGVCLPAAMPTTVRSDADGVDPSPAHDGGLLALRCQGRVRA